MSVKVGQTMIRARQDSVHSRFHSTPDLDLNRKLLNFPRFNKQKPITPTSKEVLSALQQYTADEHKSTEVLEIQSQLAEWIGSKQSLLLSQFLELMKAIAPQISSKDSTELFHGIDTAKKGEIATNILLHHEFLPLLISKVFDDHESDGSVTPQVEDIYDDDESYKDMNIKELIGEIKKLNKWIMESGEPAVEKVIELESIMSIYENERNDQELEINVLKEEISNHQEMNEARLSQSLSHSILDDNMQLQLKIEDSDVKWQQQTHDIREKEKEIQRYKKLTKEMRILNDKYVNKNEILSQQNQDLEQELNDLRERMLWFESDAMQRQQEDMLQIEKLKKTLEQVTTEWVTTDDSNNDLQRVPPLTLMGKYRSDGKVTHSRLETLAHWYGQALSYDKYNEELQQKEIENKLYLHREKQELQNDDISTKRWSIIELFANTSLMWSLPMIK